AALVHDHAARPRARREDDGGVLGAAEPAEEDAAAPGEGRETDPRRQPPRLGQRARPVARLAQGTRRIEADLDGGVTRERDAARQPEGGGHLAGRAGEPGRLDQRDEPDDPDACEHHGQPEADQGLEEREPVRALRTRLLRGTPAGGTTRAALACYLAPLAEASPPGAPRIGLPETPGYRQRGAVEREHGAQGEEGAEGDLGAARRAPHEGQHGAGAEAARHAPHAPAAAAGGAAREAGA